MANLTLSTNPPNPGDALTEQDRADLRAAISAAEAVATAAAIAARETPTGAQAKADAAQSAAATDATTKANAAQAAAIAAAATDATTKANAAAAASVPLAQKGAANGVASLDGTGKVPSAQLPGFVDDVIEAANAAALPATGSAGILYVTLDNNRTWRWSGSAYVEISPSPGSTDAVPEGSVNQYHTVARVRATVLTGLDTATAAAVTAADSILSAIGKLVALVAGKVDGTDARLSDTREWSAVTIGQVEAEGGTATTRRAWTAERVRQAIAAWWTATASSLLKTINGQSILGTGDLTVSGGGGGAYEVADWPALQALTGIPDGRVYTVQAPIFTGGSGGTMWRRDGALWSPAGWQEIFASRTVVAGTPSVSSQTLFEKNFPANCLVGCRTVVIAFHLRTAVAGSTARNITLSIRQPDGSTPAFASVNATIPAATTNQWVYREIDIASSTTLQNRASREDWNFSTAMQAANSAWATPAALGALSQAMMVRLVQTSVPADPFDLMQIYVGVR